MKKVILGAMALFIASPCFGQSKKANERKGVPGEFDYYVLTLSWSPQYCAGPSGSRDTSQCGEKKFGFVVHGFWPQYERGYPEFCADSSKVQPAIVQRMLPLMPSDRLIQHEWDRHGTCAGLGQAEYFQSIEKVFAGIRIPGDYKSPVKQVYVSPASIRKNFVSANAGMTDQSVKVHCTGRYLSEVWICVSKDLKPRPCSADVRDACREPEIIMQPVR